MPAAASPDHRVHRYDSAVAAAADMARRGAERLRSAIDARGHAALVLTGGSSPKLLYRAWAGDYADALDWRRVHVYWGDERDVPRDHDDSNTQTTKPLLDRVTTDDARVHHWLTDRTHNECTADMLRALEHGARETGDACDLVLLGLGADGHVGSCFPHDEPWTDFDEDPAPLVRHVADSPKPPASRYTFTLPLLCRAREVWLMPFGEAKRDVIDGVLAHDAGLPASYVRARHGETHLWTDVGENR